LQNSPLNVDVGHPFVLPKRHHETELIIRHYRLRFGHCGTQHVLAATRERFWIVHGHSTVRHYLKNCQTCLLWNARACGQVMAPLPKCRVTPGFRAFSCTGVDYFGAVLVMPSLDSFIEEDLSERGTATEVPTSYSPKENFVREFAVGINPRFTSHYVRKA